MAAWIDSALYMICHRGGEYSDLLPLCLRCSGVYAGVLCGVVFECCLRGFLRQRLSRMDLWLGLAAFAAMGVVGFGNIYHVLEVSAGVKLFLALWFGVSVGFFACAAIAHELSLGPRASRKARLWRTLLARGLFLLLLALWSVVVQLGSHSAVRALGWAAAGGLPVAFLGANGALALVVLHDIRTRILRAGLCAILTPAFIALELLIFTWWRKW